MSKPFIDSNFILYLLSSDSSKADQAEAIVKAGGVISVQVLSEVTSVCQRKLKMEWVDIDTVLKAVKACMKLCLLLNPRRNEFQPIPGGIKRYEGSKYVQLYPDPPPLP